MITPEILAKYEPVIGLEVHAQMLTKSKAFCTCDTKFGNAPNTNVCPICLGHPGTLPMLNENLVKYIVKMGLATNCQIRERSIFARKNYFYPDLPKGFQISQYETPICHDGWVECELPDGSYKKIGITRIHMEEDSGKSIHDFGVDTLVDLNRAGVPLIEIVSEPDMRTSEEGYTYLTTIKSIVTYLGICDGNMEEGSLRCDANVSVRLKGAEKFGQKTEVKNLNSFRNVQRAIEAEIVRQIEVIESGGAVIHQTMQFDANKGTTRPMRTKEEAADYRYFPEPDLLPVTITQKYLDDTRAEQPELQRARRDRFVKDFGIPKYDADVITARKDTSDYFENVVKSGRVGKNNERVELEKEEIKIASNIIMSEVLRIISAEKISIGDMNLTASNLAEIAHFIYDKTISNKTFKDNIHLFRDIKVVPLKVITEKGLIQTSDKEALRGPVRSVIESNPENVQKYKNGKLTLLGFFVGQSLKKLGGNADPEVVNELVKEELEKV